MKAIGFVLTVWIFAMPLKVFSDWQFSERIAITGDVKEGVFHHLEAAGRKHIAISGDRVAVLWEDDSSGSPQIYLALKNSTDSSFAPALKVSSGQEAYEPAIAGLPGGRFVLVWEQDNAIYLNTHGGQGLNRSLKLSSDSLASQASVVTANGQICVIWREQEGRAWSLQVASLLIAQDQVIELLSRQPVESPAIETPVLFPTLALNETGLYLAWEDRAAGHTRLKFSFSTDVGKSFIEPSYLNEFYSNRTEYDKGSGVTRVSMASFGVDEIVAAWMDKRRGGGYGIFASIGSDGAFGPNEKIHGSEGDRLPHYNPATSGNTDGMVVVAWDDYRAGDSDIWMTTIDETGEWGENFSPPTASGLGEQSQASVALDESGGLHLTWVERESPLAPTQLWYSYGVAMDSNRQSP
jgi:hypothetical protein